MRSSAIFAFALLSLSMHNVFAQDLTKLFVATGYHFTGETRDVELVELSAPSDCTKPRLFPVGVYGAVGAVLDGTVYICSGFQRGVYNGECYYYLTTLNLWAQATATLTTARAYSAAANLDSDRMWITGGYTEEGITATTEIYSASSDEFTAGTDLPRPLEGHCLVQLSESVLVLIGGYDGEEYSSDVFVYDTEEGAWTLAGSLEQARAGAACGVLDGAIVVAGGFDGVDILDSVEIVELPEGTTEAVISAGPALPAPVERGAAATTDVGLVLVGGYNTLDSFLDTMFALDATDGAWNEFEARIVLQRERHVALAVPDSAVQCGAKA